MRKVKELEFTTPFPNSKHSFQFKPKLHNLLYSASYGIIEIMQDLKRLLVVDFVIFQILYLVTFSNGKIEDIIEAGKKKPQPALRCHVCQSETQEECVNFTEYGPDYYGFPQYCDSEATTCMVRKFAFTHTNATTTQPMKIIAVKRNCTKTCEPGCIIMGERTRLYICNTCCKSELCNVGSGSESLIMPTSFEWNQSIALLVLIFTSFQATISSFV